MKITELTLAALYRQTVHGTHHMSTAELALRAAALLFGTAATLYLDTPVLTALVGLLTAIAGAITLLELSATGLLCLTHSAQETVPVADLRIGDVVHEVDEYTVTDELIHDDGFVGVPAWDFGPYVLWFPAGADARITARCEQNSEA